MVPYQNMHTCTCHETAIGYVTNNTPTTDGTESDVCNNCGKHRHDYIVQHMTCIEVEKETPKKQVLKCTCHKRKKAWCPVHDGHHNQSD